MIAATTAEARVGLASTLPALSVLDITDEVAREVAEAQIASGVAYIWPSGLSVVRVNEREAGLFGDVEALLGRLIPLEASNRGRLVAFLLGPRSEQVPFLDGRLCLGWWQRVLLLSFDEHGGSEWTLTVLG